MPASLTGNALGRVMQFRMSPRRSGSGAIRIATIAMVVGTAVLAGVLT